MKKLQSLSKSDMIIAIRKGRTTGMKMPPPPPPHTHTKGNTTTQ